MNQVLELADIAWPVVLFEIPQSLGREGHRRPAVLRSQSLREVFGE